MESGWSPILPSSVGEEEKETEQSITEKRTEKELIYIYIYQKAPFVIKREREENRIGDGCNRLVFIVEKVLFLLWLPNARGAPIDFAVLFVFIVFFFFYNLLTDYLISQLF